MSIVLSKKIYFYFSGIIQSEYEICNSNMTSSIYTEDNDNEINAYSKRKINR